MSVSLAEPRRRQKWTLNPRGNLWANDEDKFGQKLMEKMGWEKGKGLGANQDGRVEHIKIKQKDNQKGVGFEGHDDTWIAHQDDFQAVLAALNVEHGDGKDLSESEKKASLEAISRKSRRRVHYQKFVKGKDLDNYSADDLGCILGTKSDKMKSKAVSDGSEKSSGAATPENELVEDDTKFVQKGNYQEYFAQKMAALKAKGKYAGISTWTDSQPTNTSRDTIGFGAEKSEPEVKEKQEVVLNATEEENLELVVKKKKKKSKKSKDESKEEESESNTLVSQESEQSELSSKKQKKSKKNKEEIESNEEIENIEPVMSPEDEPLKRKKSKKNKKEKLSNEDKLEQLPSEDLSDEKLKKKKCKNEMNKSKKEDKVRDSAELDNHGDCDNNEVKNKKKKKGKKEKSKDKSDEPSISEKLKRKSEDVSEEDEEAPKKKKKKKDKCDPADAEQVSRPLIGFQGSNLLAIPGYGN